jgi:hypothetical protein
MQLANGLASEKKEDNPALLLTIIAAKPTSVGKLVDYANAIPDEWVVATASSLALSVTNDYQHGRRKAARRRRLVILGALLTRMAFDLERVPKDRDAII